VCIEQTTPPTHFGSPKKENTRVKDLGWLEVDSSEEKKTPEAA
jgi:hypothetical protein